MTIVSVRKKMSKNKVCWVIALALIDLLRVQALPSITVFGNNAAYNPGRFEALGCPENEFLNDEGKACEPTCEDPIRPDVCKEKKVITCECNEGYVRNATGVCIRPEKCLHQLPQKSENRSSSSGSTHNGAITRVFELTTVEPCGSDTVNEATISESDAYDSEEDLENTETIHSELELDERLLEYLSNAHNEYHRQHIIEHQPDQKTEEEYKIFRDWYKFNNVDYSSDVGGLVHLDNWIPEIYK